MLDAVARHPRAATVSVVLTTGTVSVVLTAGTVSVLLAAGTVSVVLAAGTVSVVLTAGGAPAALHPGRPDHPLRREPAPRGRPAPGRTCGGRTHSPAGALAPAQGRTQPARTVLVGRENGTYNVDRARTWLRESGRQVQPPCRGVRQLRGSRPLIGWSPCRYVGVSAGGAGAGARAGGGRGGRGGCQWCVHRGPGWRCCTFIPGCWSGWWRHSNVFPPREAEVSRMNVQRGRRCTFILVPRPRPPSRSA